MKTKWSPEPRYRGRRIWIKCGGCGEHFELRDDGASVSLVFNVDEADEETIDFCSQSCVDAAVARGTLADGLIELGTMSIQ